MRVLPQDAWLELQRSYQARTGPWVQGYRERRGLGESHPVWDFLFQYYQVNRSVFKRWRPCYDMRLQGEAADAFLRDARYARFENGVGLDCNRLSDSEKGRLRWVKDLLERARSRPPRFGCFGLHEWAMLYRAPRLRHETTPLRLPAAEIDRVVESMPIACTHYDAYRFFTPEAKPLNSFEPEQGKRSEMEQLGCIHFNMDLYKWCYKLHPWIGSALMEDCFNLAVKARELDMRASPYDISRYGFQAIEIETPEGRQLYQKLQVDLHEEGKLLAGRLIDSCQELLHAAEVAVVC